MFKSQVCFNMKVKVDDVMIKSNELVDRVRDLEETFEMLR